MKEDETDVTCIPHVGNEKRIQHFRIPDMERPLGRPKYRWEDNTRMNLRETER